MDIYLFLCCSLSLFYVNQYCYLSQLLQKKSIPLWSKLAYCPNFTTPLSQEVGHIMKWDTIMWKVKLQEIGASYASSSFPHIQAEDSSLPGNLLHNTIISNVDYHSTFLLGSSFNYCSLLEGNAWFSQVAFLDYN
jgi:hypothetical protein